MAAYRSYRDYRSRELLDNITFTRSDPVYSDLAFSHDIPEDIDKPAFQNYFPVVGISPIAYLSSYFWPEKNLKIFRNYLSTLTAFVSSLLQNGCRVILYYTDGPDKFVVKKLQERLMQNVSTNGNLAVVETTCVGELLTLMESVDYAVVSRLHGVILAHLMNKPVLAISYDEKVTTYMQDTLQSDYCLDIHNVHPELLIQVFSYLQNSRKAATETIAAKTALFRKELTEQYDRVLESSAARL